MIFDYFDSCETQAEPLDTQKSGLLSVGRCIKTTKFVECPVEELNTESLFKK